MLIFACLLLFVGSAMAQSMHKVTGTVTNAATGEALTGARVFVNGTSYGTITDAKGTFTLSVPTKYKQVTVSYFGMETQNVAAIGNVNVKMKENTKTLNETVVVAFGTQKKSAFTGSAKVVGSEELELAQVSNVTNALAGAVPGVQLTSSNGAPGSTSTIRIRGFSSINAGKDPLIIVDGAPYEGDIANLNPADIESMTVQKDAASNALYGARGANGVIMITTKKAKAGDAVVKFDAKWGANSKALQRYDVIESPAKYYEMHYGALKDYFINKGNSATDAWQLANQYLCSDQGDGGVGYNVYTVPTGQYMIGQNGKLNPNATLGRLVNYNGKDYLLTPDKWEDLGTRTGRRQEYNVSMAQGSDRGNIYVSLGYLDNQGITANSDMERFTARLKTEFQVKPWMKVGANMSYTRFNYNTFDSDNNGNETSSANIWAFTSQMAPIYPAYLRNPDGTVMIDANGIRMYDYGNGMNAGYGRPFISDANPIQDNQLNKYNSEGNAASGYGFADFYITKGLTATVNGTFNLDETRFNYVYNPYYGQFDTTEGTVGMQHSRYYSYNLQQLLNYSVDFGKHNLSAVAGHEYNNRRNYYLYASKSKMFDQKNTELNGAVVDGQSSGSYMREYNNEGYFLRAMYEYDGKYFANASIRRDASNRFAKEDGKWWGTFWSLGGAWMISKESWFKASWVDQLKLKASIGQQGNDQIGNYRYADLYDITNSAGNIGVSFSTKGNKNITWETKTNTNVGFEFTLFKKLTGSFEFFYGKTTDMLVSFSTPSSLGYSSYVDNVGDLYNSGVELDLSYNIINNKNFSWDVNFNISTLRNRITYLHPDNQTSVCYDLKGKAYKGYTNGSFYLAEGLSMYTWRTKEYAGVYNKDSWKKTADAAFDESKAGLSMWYYRTAKLDANNQPVKDAEGNVVYENKATTDFSTADYYVTNKSTIPSVYGGIGTKLKFRNFDFAINFSYSIGGKGWDGTYQTFMTSPTGANSGFNFHKDLLKSWSADNAGSNIPRFMWGDTYSASGSTRWLTNASYLNCENINLGYTLPDAFTRKFLVSNLRIYVAAENVFYISARKGFDPRQTYSDIANATNYAPIRTISGGISLTF